MTSQDTRVALRRCQKLAWYLDSAWRIPFTSWRFGLDSVLGLLPVIGDTLTGVMGLVIPIEARRVGAPISLQLRMLWNLGLDAVIGSIPLLGDIFDVGFRKNRTNLRLLERWLSKNGRLPKE